MTDRRTTVGRLLWREHQRRPDVGASKQRELKRLGQHADDRVHATVEFDAGGRRSRDRRRTARARCRGSAPPPVALAASSSASNNAADGSVRADHPEEVGGDRRAAGALGAIAAGEPAVVAAVGGKILEGSCRSLSNPGSRPG